MLLQQTSFHFKLIDRNILTVLLLLSLSDRNIICQNSLYASLLHCSSDLKLFDFSGSEILLWRE